MRFHIAPWNTIQYFNYNELNYYSVFSGRSPAMGSKRPKMDDADEEADDLTKDMAEPVPEPNITEVPIAKPGL